ncbi:MAG TPA: LamG domain-containing protein, partial [Candidatus Limnocylindrales bacterium]
NPVLDLVAGDYTLTIDAAGDATVGYAFRLLDLAQAPVITPGTPVTGQLNPSRATDLYRFSADAGARFYFDFRNVSAPAGSEVYWRLVDPYGNVVFDRTAFTADVGLRTLERAGMYTLIVEGRVTNSQLPTPAIGYSFNAQLIADESKTLVLGESQGTAPKWTAGQLGGAAYLDGLQYGEVAHDAAIDLTQNTTLELWFRADRLSQTWTPLLSKGNASGSDTYSLWLNSGGYVHVEGNYSTGGGFSLASAAGSVRAGEWRHVAAVLDRSGSALRLYLDGVQVASTTLSATAGLSVADALRIGHSVQGGWNLLEGAIDEVRLWNRARSAAEIAGAKDAELAGTEEGLVLYLKGNEAAGDRWLDATGNGRDALVRSLYSADSAVAGRIDHPGQRDFYNFTLTEAKRVYFDSLTNNAALTWTLVGPRGTVASRHFGASDSFDFGTGSPLLDLVAGDYALIVGGSADTVAPYAFRLLDAAQAAAVTPGTPVNGQLTPAKESDLYSFAGNAGDQFFIDSLAATGGETYWRLIDPYGLVIADRTAMGTDLGLVTLLNSGAHLLLVEGRVGRSEAASSYSFNLDPRGNVPPAPLPEGAPYTLGATAAGLLATASEE